VSALSMWRPIAQLGQPEAMPKPNRAVHIE